MQHVVAHIQKMKILTKKNLIERWQTDEGKNLLKDIIQHLRKVKTLKGINGLEKFEGKFDLRGVSFPKTYSEYQYKGKLITQVTGSLSFKNVNIDNVDFTYADLQHTKWKNCAFSNTKFSKTQLEQIYIINCSFENILFNNSRLSYSYLNIRSGKKSGHFKNVRFEKSQLNETKFSFPKFDNCLFDNCNLFAANFDGSRFKDCKFIGKVNSPWFKKHSNMEYEPNLIFNRINKKQFMNEMINIDFSEANLEYVSFDKNLDLSKCNFAPNVKFEKLKTIETELYAMSE